MAKTFTAPFAQTPKTATASVSAAATNQGTDSPTNTVLLLTAGSDGCIVTRLYALPRNTVTATVVQLFLSKDGGTTQRLIDAETMAAYTASVTTAAPKTIFSSYSESSPMRLEAGDKLYVGVMVAPTSGTVFKAEYTDF